MNARIENIINQTAALRERIVRHSLNENLVSLDHLRSFMEHHVFAVWDYMSLLKYLQKHLASTHTPWLPSHRPELCRLVNRLVLQEESGLDRLGRPQSQFEQYLAAMRRAGASTAGIDELIAKLRRGEPLVKSLMTATQLSPSAALFVLDTFNLIDNSRPHEVAAVLAFARESLVPEVFMNMLQDLKTNFPELADYHYYMEQFIEKHSGAHLQDCYALLEQLCGDDQFKWLEAQQAATKALQSRLNFWNALEINMNIAALAA
jgi:hypothetical protein